MNLNNFYVLVDLQKNIIIDKIQTLPQNWKNISNLSGLSDKELSDLTWAGYDNTGWINIYSEKIKNFVSSPENLNLNKNCLKKAISNIRKEKQNCPIKYNNAIIKSDIKTRTSLFLLKEKSNVNFKCVNGYFTFNEYQISEIYDIITEQIEYYFNLEKNIHDKIDKCDCISDFLHINYDF
jgi:hypothetical protein